jgi:hypothetical protein
MYVALSVSVRSVYWDNIVADESSMKHGTVWDDVIVGARVESQ